MNRRRVRVQTKTAELAIRRRCNEEWQGRHRWLLRLVGFGGVVLARLPCFHQDATMCDVMVFLAPSLPSLERST